MSPSDSTPRFSLSSSGGGSKRGYRPHMTPGLMEASFSLYSGWERRTLKLEPGDRVRLRLERHLESGSIHCEVTAPDGSPVLTLGDAPVDEGALQATVEGNYSVRVVAQDARGSYRLMLLLG